MILFIIQDVRLLMLEPAQDEEEEEEEEEEEFMHNANNGEIIDCDESVQYLL